MNSTMRGSSLSGSRGPHGVAGLSRQVAAGYRDPSTISAGSRRAYGVAREATATPRAIEYDALSRATGALTQAAASGAFPSLATALHDNLRLWAALAADLAGEGNGYPDALRAQLISLAAFVQRHSRLVLSGEATVAPLVEINTAVMKGLRGVDGTA